MANLLRGLNATAHRDQRDRITTPTNWAQDLFNAAQRVQLFFAAEPDRRAGCWVRNSRSTRRRPPRTARDIVNTALYGTLDKTTTLNLTPFVSQAEQRDQSARLHQLRVSAQQHVASSLQQAATDAANAQTTATAKAQAALYVVLTSSEYQVIQ